LTIADQATFESPRELPAGIEGVWVGGERVVEGSEILLDLVAGTV